LIRTTSALLPEAGVYHSSRRYKPSPLLRLGSRTLLWLPATSAIADQPKRHTSTLLPTAKAVESVLASYAFANVTDGTWMEALESRSKKCFQDLSTWTMWTTNHNIIPLQRTDNNNNNRTKGGTLLDTRPWYVVAAVLSEVQMEM
jgi:hypothetical protein